jgi:DNA-binding beta-propeller fold protein YncE
MFRSISIARFACIASLLLLAACKGGGGGDNNPPAASGGSGVGPAGGTVTGAYGATVTVPAGALSSTVNIAIARESDNAPGFPPIGVAAVGAVYEITPHSTTFSQPVTISIPFDATQVPAGATPMLYKADPGGEFVAIPTTVAGNMLVAQVTDFSNFVSAAGVPYMEAAYFSGANSGAGTVYSFWVDAATGVLTPTTQASYPNGASIMAHATDSAGRYYYAVTTVLFAPIGSPRYSMKQYTLDSDGGLVPDVSSSGFDLPADVTSAPDIAVGPGGNAAYIVGGNALALNIEQYAIGTDGALAPLSVPAAAGGADPRNMTVAPSGKFAYAVGGGEIRQYSVGADGALTALGNPTAPIATGTTPQRLVVDPSGKYAYVLNDFFDNSVSQYHVGRFGILGTPGELALMTPNTVATGANPMDIAIHPSGNYLYIVDSGGVSQYGIGAFGALAPLNPAVAALGVSWLSVDLSGLYAFGGGNANDPVVQRFGITQGQLAALGTATTLPTHPQTGLSFFGRPVFAKKPIVPGGPNTNVPGGAYGGAFAYVAANNNNNPVPPGGVGPGAGPFNLGVAFSGFGGWITGGGIDCDQGSIVHTTCSATIPSGVSVSLHVTHTDANSYNVQWSGGCSGTNLSTFVIMDSSKGCTVDLIPCLGTACTSH